jgi:Ca2+-binding EF-hand superfamily protein
MSLPLGHLPDRTSPGAPRCAHRATGLFIASPRELFRSRDGGRATMYQYTARPLSVDAVLHAASSKGKQRGATEVSGSAQKVQNLVVKQQLHNQMVQLREAFLREDQRISGTIPTYQLASCLRAGGLELDAVQTKEAHWKFMTGEGRFHWLRFCEHIEKARSKAWSQQSRIKSAKAFADIDKDGSSMLSRDEIETALTKWNVPYTDDKLDRIFTS